jgi:hypothetical protein
MLESLFPGINVILGNYPPALPKRVLSKVIPVVQTGAVIALTAGDQIFPRLGVTPPPLYYSLRANKFRSIASIWLLSNFVQSFLQSSGAFEVYFNGELVSPLLIVAIDLVSLFFMMVLTCYIYITAGRELCKYCLVYLILSTAVQP